MRIGEVVVFGASNHDTEKFIGSICERVQEKDNSICFGNLQVNEQLILYLYGIRIDNQIDHIAWDILFKKILGYVLIFDWYKPEALEQIIRLLDLVGEGPNAPLVLIGDVKAHPLPLPAPFFQDGISLNLNEKLVFGRTDNKVNCKKALITLLDIIIDKLS